eukprot:3141608-Prymnesium_polylepis.2
MHLTHLCAHNYWEQPYGKRHDTQVRWHDQEEADEHPCEHWDQDIPPDDDRLLVVVVVLALVVTFVLLRACRLPHFGDVANDVECFRAHWHGRAPHFWHAVALHDVCGVRLHPAEGAGAPRLAPLEFAGRRDSFHVHLTLKHVVDEAA